MTTIKEKIARGDVYWVDLNISVGTEVNKVRPAVIISNNIQNKFSSRVIVVPITSNTETIYPFEMKVTIAGKAAKIMADQVRSIDKSRLQKVICSLNKPEITNLDKLLKMVLSLE